MTDVMISLEDYERITKERDAFAWALVHVLFQSGIDSNLSPSSITSRAIFQAMEVVYEDHQEAVEVAFEKYGKEQ